MNPAFPFDADSAQAWLGQFFDAGMEQMLRPEALVTIILMLVSVAALALIVASMTDPLDGPAAARFTRR